MRGWPLLLGLSVGGCHAVFVLEPPLAPDAAATLACPDTFGLRIDGLRSVYRVLPAMTWPAAADACRSEQVDVAEHQGYTHLVVLDDDAEWEAMKLLVGDDAWIGLSDLAQQGMLRWVTDQPSSYPPSTGSPWQPLEPDRSGRCVLIRSQEAGEDDPGTLEDDQCNELAEAICECDEFPNDPKNYAPPTTVRDHR